ncbi:CDP-diacylglycerol--glycerol-3-phosphate 3-phosphatidyltransferase [Sporobacter termitidis DSM 10068]|uniref:CDP-diacylglycerol--glycerol-3-phosphate 3-phosphatidyltransferase n=1 Tax=Sporobacter termitidis DSM 10068 TaxID=1123282 RepID=A0A1M5ZEV3_9FIRM|nr:CDP-diacylglycerol--glycerol-3-phosphate 3-phosphatidyltransferase [Sporobacter termitidis]SHI22795.1 CDP-diacylglycerol--glycerol-3-phosphate 3-phosphatidyltransferase [Sporobacter termitidis DSM 10068]
MKNVPNILSSIRICLVPVFVAAYFCDPSSIKIYAAVVYAAASFTDFLDGYIARKYNLISNLGKLLDPLGDKLMTLAVLTCITIDNVIPVWAVLVAVCKEVLMVVGGALVRKKEGGEIPPSNIIGKTSTVVFFVVCVTLMLFNIPDNIATIMISVAIVLMLVALASYINTFIRVMKTNDGFKKEI